MEQIGTVLAAAAESDGGVNPLFFVLGALALILVSTLGPLSRMHERREARRTRPAATEPPAGEGPAVTDGRSD
ncbi:hypothetical protein [Nakamurella deserti]|uniref:hypothetical protein n=1 Tax=Nakamurella deserti TaxID=2164074 RepID=UPI000DBE6C12|nr:hypothetical protein [Nakamurella deserti]